MPRSETERLASLAFPVSEKLIGLAGVAAAPSASSFPLDGSLPVWIAEDRGRPSQPQPSRPPPPQATPA